MVSINSLSKLSFGRGFGLFLLGGIVLFGWIVPDNPPAQPIQYNHSVHIENGLECLDCHVGAREQAQATLPSIETCLMCHSESLSESSEEEKIRQWAAAGQEIPWVQRTRVPRHVYFSHRRHVALAGLECGSCHGAMETLTLPPERPLRDLTMEACIDCHEQRSVSHECNDCHR